MNYGYAIGMSDLYVLVKKGGMTVRDAVNKLAKEKVEIFSEKFFYSDIRQIIESPDIESLIYGIEKTGIERFGLGRNV